ETIKPIPQKWCNLWPTGMPFPEDWFKMCRGY
ncbi:phage virulence factor, partial [Salmonella enterica subsp. enterica serovar Bredeney]|nr:phage virulence factor [Salmonella enterica subsp. enterica serovar Schwarzengrund]EDW2045613.1 phage virulence factor [Salmonella enterica subsp. enterica serovar Bredeney]